MLNDLIENYSYVILKTEDLGVFGLMFMINIILLIIILCLLCFVKGKMKDE